MCTLIPLEPYVWVLRWDTLLTGLASRPIFASVGEQNLGVDPKGVMVHMLKTTSLVTLSSQPLSEFLLIPVYGMLY